MQTKINKVRDQIVSKLNELGIEFSVEDMDIEKEDLSTKLTGYKIVASNLIGCIVPNFKNKRPEYLIFNDKLVSHLISEGHDDAYIEEHGKIWIHLLKQSNFVEVFKQSHAI
jgi:hypothetical protein